VGVFVDESRCEVTDLPKYMCSHCKQNEVDPTEGYRLVTTFKASYSGPCSLSENPDHLIVQGRQAGLVEATDANPFKTEKEYCCARCVKRFFDRARA
jgi:DNA-directed RNA polymerase subunit RPC12/RpoP